MQKQLGPLPNAADGPFGNAEQGGDLTLLETEKVTELDDASRSAFEFPEATKRLVDFQDLFHGTGIGNLELVRRDGRSAAASLSGKLPSRAIDEDLAHCLSGDEDEVGSILPLNPAHRELEIRLVDEGYRIGVSWNRAVHGMGISSQVGIDASVDPIELFPIPSLGKRRRHRGIVFRQMHRVEDRPAFVLVQRRVRLPFVRRFATEGVEWFALF